MAKLELRTGLGVQRSPGRPLLDLCALKAVPLSFQQFDERLAEPCWGGRDADAGRLHGGDLVLGSAFPARDDRTRVAHAAARRRGAPGDEADRRSLPALLSLLRQELRRVLLGRAADFANHDDRL